MKEYTHLHIHGHITMSFITDITHARSIQACFLFHFVPSNGTLNVDCKQGCLAAAIISKGFLKDIIPIDV